MITPGKPIIDTRSTVFDENPGYTPPATGGSTGQQPAPAATQPITPAGSPSSSTTTTTTVKNRVPLSQTIPTEYTASSYADLIPQLERAMRAYTPPTEEELEKIRRRQKAEGIISGISDAVQSVANLVATHNYAPNMYDPKEGMSAKAKERFDKEKAERDANADKFFNYALTIGKLKDTDKDRALQAWQTEQTLARQDQAYEAGRQDRADDVAFRNKDYDERLRQWQLNFDREGEWHKEEASRWERQFKESIRQFNVSSANERARIGLEAQRLAHELKSGQMTFNLGSGHGNVTLSLDKLNAQTVSRIFSTLPDNVKNNVQGDPIYKPLVKNGVPQYDLYGKPIQQIVGYGQPSTEAMLIAIGANVEANPTTQEAIRQVAGLERETMPGTNNTMPGVK